jgi:hypothetical protein
MNRSDGSFGSQAAIPLMTITASSHTTMKTALLNLTARTTGLVVAADDRWCRFLDHSGRRLLRLSVLPLACFVGMFLLYKGNGFLATSGGFASVTTAVMCCMTALVICITALGVSTQSEPYAEMP